jgi:hypothetical protein
MNFVIDKSDIEKLSKTIVKFAEKKALKIAADVVKKQELEQTSIGRDYQGNFFKSYKKGTVYERNRMGLRTDIVNLTVTGDLKRSRYFDGATNELRYPDDMEDLAGYLNDGTEKMNARPFVGISEMDIPLIEKAIIEGMETL